MAFATGVGLEIIPNVREAVAGRELPQPPRVRRRARADDPQPRPRLKRPPPWAQRGLQDQVTQLLVAPDQRLQPVHRDHQDRAGLLDHRGGEQPLSGENIQLGHELARPAGRQLTLNPGLIDYGDRSGQDHDEVVAAPPSRNSTCPAAVVRTSP